MRRLIKQQKLNQNIVLNFPYLLLKKTNKYLYAQISLCDKIIGEICLSRVLVFKKQNFIELFAQLFVRKIINLHTIIPKGLIYLKKTRSVKYHGIVKLFLESIKKKGINIK